MLACFSVVAGLVVLLFHWRFFFFFRDPERTTPSGKNIVSPADGRVVYVKKVSNNTVPIAIKKRRTIPLRELIRVDEFRQTDTYGVLPWMRILLLAIVCLLLLSFLFRSTWCARRCHHPSGCDLQLVDISRQKTTVAEGRDRSGVAVV